MKQRVLIVSCCLIMGGAAATLHAAVTGSVRPVVQKNFNQLIEKNSCPGCDLAGVSLIRVDLSGANLEGANLAGAKLYLADLSNANLRSANLQGAALGGADMAGADLSGANLTGAILEGAYLSGAITESVITSASIGDGDGNIGETVLVTDESLAKHNPYSQEVVIDDRRDLVETQPGEEPSDTVEEAVTKSALQVKDTPAIAQSKQPVPMADVVVPVLVSPPEPSAEPDQDTTIILADQSKHEVALQDEAVAAGGEELQQQVLIADASDSVSEDTAEEQQVVNEEVVDQEEDVSIADEAKNSPPIVDETVEGVTGEMDTVSSDSSTLVVADEQTEKMSPASEVQLTAEKKVAPEPVQKAADEEVGQAHTRQGHDPEDIEQENDSSSVQDMVADVEEDVQPLPQTGESLVYTVETPDQAAARQQTLIERLLDDDTCVACDLTGVDLSGKRLNEVDLERADLKGANLEDVNLSEANLKGANLSGANLRNADLSEADLYRANLSGADLTDADLTETLLDSADLTGAIGLPQVAE